MLRAVLPRELVEAISIYRRRTFSADGVVTNHVADFLLDERFMAAYGRGKATGSWPGGNPIWRTYVAIWAAQHAALLPGDFAECGVNRGGMSLAIMEYLGFNSLAKRFYLLDTFAGFPRELLGSVSRDDAARYSECYQDVRATFADYPRAVVIRGKVPDTLKEVDSSSFSYLSLDMNCAEPEIAAMRFFWPLMVPGGIVVLDDYAFSEMYRPQKTAFDKLARELNFSILSLPTGQGLVVKGYRDAM